MKKVLFFSVMCLMAVAMNAQKYVDLGLSSGTKWKSANEGFYLSGEASNYFGKSLPSDEQWMELRNECDWIWTGMGYKVVGPNGNYITLSAAGCESYSGDMYDAGSIGYYWSYTEDKFGNNRYLRFDSRETGFYDNGGWKRMSVRLVYNP